MPSNYLIIDANSLGHFANNGARLTIGDLEVHAIYNFLRSLRSYVALYRHHVPVCIWDGASWRKMMFPDYKANREKQDTKNEIKMAAAKQSYKKQAPYIEKALGLLGVAQVRASNMEADDLGALLCDRYSGQGSKVVLLTGDQDWLQMVGTNVVWRDFINKQVVNAASFEEKTGVKTAREFVEVKALCGDSGDNIAGVGGIGHKGAVDFIKKYGSFDNFLNMVVIEKTEDYARLPKKLQALVDDEIKAITFSRNIDLMDLRTKTRPAMINFTLNKGEPDLEKFRRFCDVLLFASITQELEEWTRVFPAFKTIDA